MKNNYIFIIILLVLLSCKNKTEKIVQFDVEKIKYLGNIKVGDTARNTFYLRNLSNDIIKIKNVKTSCGCTLANISDTIIKPNTNSQIKTIFVAKKGDIGIVEKSVIIEANTEPTFIVLYIKANIIN
ncbi:hypothetical protein B0A58_03530 [Flavobacterium branchiophilum NBRC 15030 = ATCC 35035]|uniref:Uncharacterized protein DUF1573 n=1 Tax=Flavobacterium branchiophilum TaxID=55197 RepID=A0A543G2M1_9FLAO|nr:DUF1573 domain-containing protein [Flavobacterium branchiophilum]OXA79198.1 hypothetical protein B0A58_03530 [Flavobacterium branchiophilum NBRC 15030 = ATCC 35035]TQM40318.1 uncharacterized protein DUF1573 [Flavobacterium branchiophilum]GEM54015.1 hypothetical protein FB1_02360 [Flavobacterium branchiophilum NBRC 15030 = ATCC 35035]